MSKVEGVAMGDPVLVTEPYHSVPFCERSYEILYIV